jgi:RNA binding exosome subunit|tara:strand:+ start:221 stop:475 length:255 start_codon:yes stop_codon:yes gene_type:complete
MSNGSMRHKEYTKLMKTPFEELSKENQDKRRKEFKKRLGTCSAFLNEMIKGSISKETLDLLEEDDPIKEACKVLIINNTIQGEA